MIKVWILIAFLSGDAGHYGINGPLLIDNIASHSECEKLRTLVRDLNATQPGVTLGVDARCVEVQKVK